MKIDVRSFDLGFFTEVPITVQRFYKDAYDEELIWCNHDGANFQESNNESYLNDRVITWASRILVCNKCGAYQHEGENYWYEAPENGVR